MFLDLQEKCHQYWPIDSEPVYYGDLKVVALNNTKCPNWIVSEFEVSEVFFFLSIY